jgi:Flp pilus assembly pilin Flp
VRADFSAMLVQWSPNSFHHAPKFAGLRRRHWPIKHLSLDLVASMQKYLRLIRLPSPRRRRAMLRLAAQALRDERGGEVLEYAVVAGLIVVASIGVIGCVGSKVLARWTSLNSKL